MRQKNDLDCIWDRLRGVPVRFSRVCCLIVVCLLKGPGLTSAPNNWYTPFPPHQILQNLYYVGTTDLAEYLVATPEGHILINSNFERTVPLLRESVEKLGFKMKDIKILLTSHAHSDHAGGHARVRELTGARVMVMVGDVDTIRMGRAGIRACPVDRVLQDGDVVTLGGISLIARLTPGHTPGCTTWTLKLDDHGTERQIVIVGSPNVNPGYVLVNNREYPTIAKDFERTFEILKKLPCDIFLGAHGSYYGLETKYRKLHISEANPFIDPEGYSRYVTERESAFRKELEKQERTPPRHR